MKLSQSLFGWREIFSLKVIAKKYELIPLLAIVGVPCTLAVSYTVYSLYQKSDVRMIKSSEYPPWEMVDPTKPQKLYTANRNKGNYKPIPELEKLKKEIGSYKT